jgi:carbamoyl-phosphate synthase large subunit
MNILITAIGCPGFKILYDNIVRFNKDIVFHGCDIKDVTNKKYVKKFFIMRSGNAEEYAYELTKYCVENNIKYLFPLADSEIISVNKNKSFFEQNNIKIFGNTNQKICDIFQKEKLLDYVCKINSNIVPEYKIIKNEIEFKDAHDFFKKKNKTMCIKPSVAHGSRGFRVIKNTSYKDYVSKKLLPYMTYEQYFDMINKIKIDTMIAMEYLPGKEYSVDCIKYRNDFYCVIRSRDEVINGIASKGTICELPDLLDISREIYEYFEFDSNINIQFKEDKNGNFKILEINPRLSGSVGFSIASGVDLIQIGLAKLFKIQKEFNNTPAYGMKIEKEWKILKK